MNAMPRSVSWNELIKPDRVHGGLYRDPTFFQLDLERIWYRTWIYIGHESEIPNRNDFIAKSIARHGEQEPGRADRTHGLLSQASVQIGRTFELQRRDVLYGVVHVVPANGDDIDPEQEMSIIYDNRSRIGLRVKQLLTGKHHTQSPQSRLRRLISNVELFGEDAKGIRVGANAIVFESNQRGDTIWGARLEYVLRSVEGDFKIAWKKVALVNNDKPIYTLSFLI